jgi:hypothetical protein
VEGTEEDLLEFRRALGLFDSVMIVAGIMVGSGIFIVSAEIARQVGSPAWLLVVWAVTGLLTIGGALSYGELAAMMPQAGGMYVYLREAFSPLWGFLYGRTLLGCAGRGRMRRGRIVRGDNRGCRRRISRGRRRCCRCCLCFARRRRGRGC